MKRVDGLRYKEIAEILHISEKTVEKHVSIAIKKIDKMLSEQPELKKLLKK
jgi:RNA polymerase sigma-70 factor (ECF subfamily)